MQDYSDLCYETAMKFWDSQLLGHFSSAAAHYSRENREREALAYASNYLVFEGRPFRLIQIPTGRLMTILGLNKR